MGVHRKHEARPMKRSGSAGIVLVVAAAVLCGCGASGGPLREVTGAVSKTLAVSWARYEVALERPQLFAAPIAVQGGRAGYDFRTGLGYEFLLPNGDPGSVVNVSGAAVLASSRHRGDAERFVAFLVSRASQRLISQGDDYEYPVRPGVAPNPQLRAFASIRTRVSLRPRSATTCQQGS